jgi:hypothetical protein
VQRKSEIYGDKCGKRTYIHTYIYIHTHMHTNILTYIHTHALELANLNTRLFALAFVAVTRHFWGPCAGQMDAIVRMTYTRKQLKRQAIVSPLCVTILLLVS